MAQYPKIESIGSIGSIILAILEVQVNLHTKAPKLTPGIETSWPGGCLRGDDAADGGGGA